MGKYRVDVARVYDERGDGEGVRILVDRLWPRGVSKDDPRIDEWNKDVAPTSQLRRWYGHEADRFEEFCDRYADELAAGDQRAAVDALAERAGRGRLTLVTATKDLEHSHVGTLRDAVAGPRK